MMALAYAQDRGTLWCVSMQTTVAFANECIAQNMGMVANIPADTAHQSLLVTLLSVLD